MQVGKPSTVAGVSGQPPVAKVNQLPIVEVSQQPMRESLHIAYMHGAIATWGDNEGGVALL